MTMNKIFKHIKNDDWGVHCEISGKQYLFATTEFYGGESVYGVRFPNDDHVKKFVHSKRAKNFYLKFEWEVKRFLKTSAK